VRIVAPGGDARELVHRHRATMVVGQQIRVDERRITATKPERNPARSSVSTTSRNTMQRWNASWPLPAPLQQRCAARARRDTESGGSTRRRNDAVVLHCQLERVAQELERQAPAPVGLPDCTGNTAQAPHTRAEPLEIGLKAIAGIGVEEPGFRPASKAAPS